MSGVLITSKKPTDASIQPQITAFLLPVLDTILSPLSLPMVMATANAP